MAIATRRRYFRHGFLPQLMAFEACVRLGSVTRAAEELCLAQPTVSCMLRKLSEAIGGSVTVVRARRVQATERGERLLALAREIGDACDRHHDSELQARAEYDRPAASLLRTPWLSNYP
jgi:DNA-binding transcriptional LysR family regulator